MDFKSAKEDFIQAWATLGTAWGINKTMSQIFALLIITPTELTVEEIMEELSISRGNASMNLRTLMDWELVQKVTKKGERKEYFSCDRDIWSLSRKVAEVRKNKEVTPILKVLEKVSQLEEVNSAEAKEFIRVIGELKTVVKTTDQALTHFINSDRSWVSKTVVSLLKSKN